MTNAQNKSIKQILAGILAFCLLLSAVPMPALAAGDASFAEELLACGDAQSMLALLNSDADRAAGLSVTELAAVISAAEAFPDSDAKTQLLAELVALTAPAKTAAEPTEEPTAEPTEMATVAPTSEATVPPTDAPTEAPTTPPTEAPTEAPTVPPTEAPTVPPTEAPTVPSTEAPTTPPTEAATVPVTESTEAAGYYMQLLACVDAETMLIMLLLDTAAASALTAEELAALTALAESFPEDAEGVTDREDLLATLDYLSGQLPENVPVTLEGAMKLTAQMYDKDPGEQGAKKLADLALEGSGAVADMGAWAYNFYPYLYIDVDNIPSDGEYEIVITMQPLIKALSIPVVAGTDKAQFTVNKMSVNDGGTFTAENYSGTIVYPLLANTQAVGFAVQLGYDITLWNKLANELNNDPSVPLLSVQVRKKDSGTPEQKVNLHKAQAEIAWPETSYTHLGGKVTDSTTKSKDEETVFGFSRMVNGSYTQGFYYPRLIMSIDVPQHTKDGKTNYLDFDLSRITYRPKGGKALANVVYDEANHRIYIDIQNYYSTDNNPFMNLYFSLPSDLAEALGDGTFAFKGKFAAYHCRQQRGELSTDQQEVIAEIQAAIQKATNDKDKLKISTGANFTVKYVTNTVCKIVSHSRGAAPVSYNGNIIQYLGTMSLLNDGYGASPELALKYTFDTQNTGKIHVTTVNLPVDVLTKEITVDYTMVDAAGNVVVTDGQRIIENTKFKSETAETGDENTYIQFRRSAEDIEKGYYFKTIEYTLKSVLPRQYLYSTGGNKSPTSGGTVWGYVEDCDTAVESMLEITEKETAKPLAAPKISTKISGKGSCGYYLVDGATKLTTDTVKNQTKATIAAGESFTLSARVAVMSYPYCDTSGLRGIRVGLNLPNGVAITAATAKTTKGQAVDVTSIEAPTADCPIWVITFDQSVTVGRFSESLVELPLGDGLNFTVTLTTEKIIPQQTLKIRDIMWAAGYLQSNEVSGNYKENKITDTYDLNGNGSKSDAVACFDPQETCELTIAAKEAKLDITASARRTMDDNNISGESVAMEHFADEVIYDLQIACTDGGTASDFYYLIPIPKADSPSDADFVEIHYVNLAASRAPYVTNTHAGATLELLFAEADPGTDYDVLIGSGMKWQTEAEWVADHTAGGTTDWSRLAFIKVISKDGADISTGALSTVSVPMVYAEDNYSYALNANKYKEDAGMTVKFSSRGHYNHDKGSQSYSGTNSCNKVIVRLEYTIPKTIEVTLVAAKGGHPEHKTTSITITDHFRLEQHYGIRRVVTNGVTLVTSDADFSKLNSNTNFGITAQMMGNPAQDVLKTASVTEPIQLGDSLLQSGTGLTGDVTFTFEIFNGDALSDTVTPRSVQIDIIGNNGVTIPVKITILREAAPITDVSSSLMYERCYLPFIGIAPPVEISRGSALTAQFVTEGYSPSVYPTSTLSFDCAPAAGTTVLMVDCTVENQPQFYYCELNGSTKSIALKDFTSLKDGTDYIERNGEAEITETLLFVVDFPDTAEASTTITLTKRAADTAGDREDQTVSLSYAVKNARTFGLSVPGSVTVETPFNVTYSTTAPDGYDNRYDGRSMALLIEPKSGILPADARLDLGNNEYCFLNAQGQFLLPLNMTTDGTYAAERTLRLLSETLDHPMTLVAKLYVSATGDDDQPMAGEVVASGEITVNPLSAPAFKVTGMDKRMFVLNADKLAATVSYAARVTGCTVTLEVQKKANTGYVSGLYLKTLNGNPVTSTVTDITPAASGSYALVFTDLEKGTYRLRFCVKRDGQIVLTIPYNFLVIEE